jgi:hypothetical protein
MPSSVSPAQLQIETVFGRHGPDQIIPRRLQMFLKQLVLRFCFSGQLRQKSVQLRQFLALRRLRHVASPTLMTHPSHELFQRGRA